MDVYEDRHCYRNLINTKDLSFYRVTYKQTDLLVGSENVYVFASHKHVDHYNKCIFEFEKNKADIIYILDGEIKVDTSVKGVNQLKKGDIYKDERITVKAFDSTDIGISFLVTIDGYTVFHAGDLNFWHWEEEADEEYINNEKKKFLDVVDLIEKETSKIDLILFPVDYRMGKNGDLGAIMMLERFKPKLFVPMHFQNNFKKIEQFKNKNKAYMIWDIKKRGDVLKFI